MLEDYLAFAKGDGGEEAAPTNVGELLEEVQEETEHFGTPIEVQHAPAASSELVLPLEAAGLQARHHQPRHQCRPLRRPRHHPRRPPRSTGCASRSTTTGRAFPPAERDNVFRPFYRLDHARNQDEGNTGLGLAIARDIARSHGGDIALGDSSMGGLRATMRVPL